MALGETYLLLCKPLGKVNGEKENSNQDVGERSILGKKEEWGRSKVKTD